MPKLFNRKPSKMMIELLMEIHERELLNLPPVTATQTGVAGLIVRSMIKLDFAKNEYGKNSLCIFITSKGKSYLENLS